MALSHVWKNSQASGKATTKRRCHPDFGRFQIVADADGKASLHIHLQSLWYIGSFNNFTLKYFNTLEIISSFTVINNHKYIVAPNNTLNAK